MAAIWNEINLVWDGESYTIRPTMEFINLLESKPRRSLAQLLMRFVDRDLPSSIACDLIADTLRWAGVKNITAEDVYAATNGGMSSDAIEMASAILFGVMPKPEPEDDKKKQPAQQQRQRSQQK